MKDTRPAVFGSSDDFKAALADNRVIGVRKQLGDVAVKAEEDGSLSFVLSTAAVDRSHDVIEQAGWKLDAYRKNPVVLWAHDYQVAPIATARSVGIEDGRLVARGVVFAGPEAVHTPDGTPGFGHSIGEMYRKGFLNAVSVGFRPLKWNWNEDRKSGIDFHEQELLEWSAVPVPANPEALVGAKAAGIPLEPLIAWAEKILDESRGDRTKLIVPREQVEGFYRAAKGPAAVQVPAKAEDMPAPEDAGGACDACLACVEVCGEMIEACEMAAQVGGPECAAACQSCADACDACATQCETHGEDCAGCAVACEAAAAGCRLCVVVCEAGGAKTEAVEATPRPKALDPQELAARVAVEVDRQMTVAAGRA